MLKPKIVVTEMPDGSAHVSVQTGNLVTEVVKPPGPDTKRALDAIKTSKLVVMAG